MKTRTVVGEPRQLDRKQWRASAIDPRAFDAFFAGGYTPTEIANGVAIVYVCGPLDHHQGWWLDSYDSIVCRVSDALADPDVRAVVMCFDTPGGDASGVEEAHQKIKAMRAESGKPIYAYSDESCYSAGYWLAAACDEIWLPRTGGVGSVGVIAEAVDVMAANEKAGVRVELVTTGKQKADGHPDRPLTDEILGRVQERVNKIGAIFFASVAAGRGMKPAAVEALQAGTFLGDDAVSAGLADGVAGCDAFLETVRKAAGIDTGKIHATTTRTHMAQKLLALTAAVTAAQTALAAAKTDEERTACEATLAAALDAKVKYSKRTRTDELEEDDGEDDEDDAPPSSKPGKSEDEDAEDEDAEEEDAEDDEADDEAEDEDAEDEAKARSKSLKALAKDSGLSAKLYDAVVALTGKRNLSEALGALAGIKTRLGAVSKLEGRVAKLETTSRKDRVSAMLSKATTSGQITPGQVEHLRAQGMKDPKWLKGYLASLPKSAPVRTVEDGPTAPRAPEGEQAALSLDTMTPAAREIYESAARTAGVSLDDYLKAAKATALRMAPTRPTH